MRRFPFNAVALALLLFISCKNKPAEKFTGERDSVKNSQYLKATENQYSIEITKNRACFDAYVHRAITRIMLADYRGALSDCESAIKIDPKKCPHFVLGEARAGLNDYAGAVDAYTNEIKANPGDDLAYSRRADAEQKIKDTSAALKDYDSAIQANPTYGYTYQRRGMLEIKMKRRNEACADFEKARELGIKSAGKGYGCQL